MTTVTTSTRTASIHGRRQPSGSAGQLARQRGLARLSAVTFGIGAASVLGAVAIAVTLPDSTAQTFTKTVNAATLTRATPLLTTVDVVWSQPSTTKPAEATNHSPVSASRLP